MKRALRLLAISLPACAIYLAALGVAWGGPVALALLLTLALLPRRAYEREGDSPGLLSLTAVLHIGVLVAVGALASRGASVTSTMALVAACWWLGQCAMSCAHELIHRAPRLLRKLGAAIFASMGWGHHVSAHLLVHHVHVATPLDPNTARLGESLWRFLPRAAWGSFHAAWTADQRRGCATRSLAGQLLIMGGTVAGLSIAFGLPGAIGWLLVSVGAIAQLLAVDYVQHYGLLRATVGSKVEPVGPAHSWNAPMGLMDALTFNAGRHGAHHAAPRQPYPELPERLGYAPCLPAPLAIMVALATIPPLWRAAMDQRAAAWQVQARPGASDVSLSPPCVSSPPSSSSPSSLPPPLKRSRRHRIAESF